MSVLTIPCFLCTVTSGTGFHIFVDASSLAYGAATCITGSDVDATFNGLIAAKAHGAPMSTTSILCLEMTAALIGLCLPEAVEKALGVTVANFTFWTDSMDILYLVYSHSWSLKLFVGRHVAGIQEQLYPAQWEYVPSRVNVADIAACGVNFEQLQCMSWFIGSVSCLSRFIVACAAHVHQWLRLNIKLNQPNVQLLSLNPNYPPDLVKFSLWTHLLRRTVYILQCISNCNY